MGFSRPNVAQDARARYEAGHTILAVTHDCGMKVDTEVFANIIEDAEREGWHLEHIYQAPGRQLMIFRRAR